MHAFSDDDEDLGSGTTQNNLDSFTINETFAKNYTQRKKKQELAQLTEKYGNQYSVHGSDDSDEDRDDEPEDEDGELITPQVDAQIMKTIAMIKSKNPQVYNPQVSFFSETEMEVAKNEWEKKRAQSKSADKPMYLKDFHRKELLSKVNSDGDYQDDDEESEAFDNHASEVHNGPSHVEEQASLKKAFKKAAFGNENSTAGAEDADDEDLFTVRPRTIDEYEKESEEYSQFLLDNMGMENPNHKSWENLKKTEPMEEDEMFLMDYILNRGWIEKDANRMPTYDEVIEDEDEDAVEAAEEFEHKFNFRFEEEGGAQIVGHARNIDGLLRRTDDSRKRKREEQKLRKEEDKKRRTEELKHLKNLKREELATKLQKIRDMSGGHIIGLEDVDLDKDFDPIEYDLKMQRAFDDSYYDSKDASIKPKFDDDIDVSDLTGELSEAPKLKKVLPKNHPSNDDVMMDADYLPGGDYYQEDYNESNTELTQETENTGQKSSKKDKKKTKEGKKMNLGEYLDEYYQLDYEDLIGDLPTRFKYRSVNAEDYGLKAEEILEADDTELNNVISLKKLAPYRRSEAISKDLLKWSKSKKKRLFEFRSQLKARRNNNQYVRPTALGPADSDGADEEDGYSRKDKTNKMKRAGINENRLDTYISGSIKKKPKH
ncbi:hypothetical protein BASA50_005226 [Batrachochytrium salamandrivorans]|uniref:Kri1-like C-terminal domain-containing protein n=1 Tax=Batrachochytrium salamandrivorans TaxID=1357716 RepID=A0ABQ8FDG6_9FUNG|nr:hypothetical protein BASA62_004577 [Batrachochytrium salamandrivorans]KAH6596186.1 hypothetical protein BASA50_005226 [Batrachochytrium salamandrivorans]